MARPLRLEFPGVLFHQRMETPDILSLDGILCRFAHSRHKVQTQYRHVVRAAKKEASPWKELKGRCLLGGKELIERLSSYLKQKETIKEIRLVDRQILRPELAQLFSEPILAGKSLRNRAMNAAYFAHG